MAALAKYLNFPFLITAKSCLKQPFASVIFKSEVMMHEVNHNNCNSSRLSSTRVLYKAKWTFPKYMEDRVFAPKGKRSVWLSVADLTLDY